MSTPTSNTIGSREFIYARKGTGIAWLAGYPRSGAARVRTILAHCFGMVTGSIYKETNIGAGYSQILNCCPEPWPVPEVEACVQRQKWLFYKTHEVPAPNESVPTIVIVRDGRRTLESLRAFYADRNNIVYTVEKLVEDQHKWGSWSDWIKAWAVGAPPDTLWLRYEDLMADVPTAVDRIARRFDLTPIAHEVPPFEELHKLEPQIFRKCEVEGNGGMTEAEEETFWKRHGSAMTLLGYHR